LETEIEFVEEDVATMEREGVLAQLKEVQSELEQLAKTFDQGKILTEGIRVVLSGRPNTGKSSIFNKLLKYERAIVTPYAGTTRDTLLEKLDIEGIPVLLIDTAGIREGLDPIEEEGVIRSKQNLRDADLALLVLDSQDAWTEEDEKVWKEVRLKPYLVVRNKIDLVRRLDIPEYVSEESAGSIEISAKEGKNLHNLALSIIQTIAPEWGRLEKEGILITHLRHQKALLKSSEEIGKGIEALKAKLSEEYALFDLKNALGSLGEITGETTSEEILGRIFSTFCIGK
jgi:tRNA modification GTPase